MKLKKLYIKNFRGYSEINVDFDDLTAFVGKNDVGKSSILEALDIFFNEGNGTVKFDLDDINSCAKLSDNPEVILSCTFSNIPDKIIIDSTNETTLGEEFLLNADGDLEIVKKFSPSGKPKIYVKANHPSDNTCKDLLQKKENDLRKIIRENHIICENQNVNSIMRKAIRNHFNAIKTLNTLEIDISKGDTVKSIWQCIQKYLPIYSLFKSDRTNNDTDEEIQDPLKEAVKQVFTNSDLKTKLEEVASCVVEQLTDVASRTLCKLKEMNPNIAENLSPRIPDVNSLKWADVFKSVSIAGDENIPINKRGSGVKRLILLNFFRAEVERLQQEKSSTNVIYAIEEPETSQHFDYQRILVNAFKDMSNNPSVQVFLTTHSPIVVKQISDYSLLRIVLIENDIRKVKKVDDKILTFHSLNEVIYLAFGETSEEYHDELYGYLKENNLFNDYSKDKEKLSYYKFREDNSIQIPLSTYIRHQIHHPENTRNRHFTQSELTQSIKDMRSFIKNLCR